MLCFRKIVMELRTTTALQKRDCMLFRAIFRRFRSLAYFIKSMGLGIHAAGAAVCIG